MDRLDVSVVVPLHNEGEVVDQLVERCLRALDSVPGAVELIAVDDASTDDTLTRLQQWQARDSRVRAVHLAVNVGQFQATQAGLQRARGGLIATLDGDLQDPPELLPTLVAALRDAPTHDVVFACKSSRRDPAWLKFGAWGHKVLQEVLCGRPWPGAVGSYVVMRADVARHVAALRLKHANLSGAIIGRGVTFLHVDYARDIRRNGESRVGAVDLVLEALGSLQASGALYRATLGLGIAAAVVGIISAAAWAPLGVQVFWWLAATGLLCASAFSAARTRAARA